MNFNLNSEQILLQKTIKEFVEKEIEPIAVQTDENGCLPDDLIRKMVNIQLPGMMIPYKYGGNGSGLFDCTLTIEQLSYSGCGAWWYAAFTNSLPDCIAEYGTEEQKAAYLPPVVSGEMIPSIQFTEEETGSDPKIFQTRALKNDQGYTVSGVKRFSTFGARDGFSILYTRDQDDNCTAFLLKKKVPGYSTSSVYQLMGSGGIEAVDVYLDQVQIPEGYMLSKPGKGFKLLLYWIAIEKILQCAACVGIAQAALDESIRYTSCRMVKNRPQHSLQGIRFMMADMYAGLQAIRQMAYHSAFLKDVKDPRWITEAAAVKIFIIPKAMEIVDTARKIHGAYGYIKGCKIERLYRAIAGASAIAGSLEVNRTAVANALLSSSR